MDTATVAVSNVATDPERPKPAEVLSQDQLEAHAALIAAGHEVAANPRRARPLLSLLDKHAARLDEAYLLLSSAERRDPQPVGSEDWLRDNHHVVQDQVRQIRQDLPRGYYLELPKIANEPNQGLPRVYVLARDFVTHTAGRFDLEALVGYTRAYQKISELSMGEIWAIPIMLRLALIEELRRLADGVVAARQSRDNARRWQANVAGSGVDDRDIGRMLRDARQGDGRLSPTFVVEVLQWLRDQPSSAAELWQALQKALQAQDDSPEEVLRIEHQREASDQLAIGNVITSMRQLSSIDSTLFFERVSQVERILRDDPASAYAAMDVATRDRYRHSIEQVARGANIAESLVAARAIALARTALTEQPEHDRRHHVGYYLISRGRFRLERDVGYRATVQQRLARFVFRHPALGYLGVLGAATALGVGSLLSYASGHGATGPQLWLVLILTLLPVSELVISLLNLIITSELSPRQLPKLAMRRGIPATDRTMVVVPVIVRSEAAMSAHFDDLEVRFLANRDPYLHFGLLSDFADADVVSKPGDEAIVETAQRRVAELNERYGGDRFFFFQRARRWNERQGRWIGWERKRGKLTEFNHLLRGATDTSFVVSLGDLSVLPSIKFVITLDSDTQLPMESARRLVGTLAHPLNRPRFDPVRQRVTEGYGVLQPRIGVNLVSANRTTFAKVLSGHVGVDPYTTAVSDIYQDLFHEGSYVGKGIYDVDAFAAALAGRVPENALLSHDLFEGFYARAGLCTDIHLIDDYPSHYLAYAARQHRWVRGDWQIVRWLWRTVPDSIGRAVPNGLPAVARWKILDNLRRSLLPPALVLLLAAAWTILPGSALVWTVLAFLVLAFPGYAQLGRSLSNRYQGVPFKEHVAAEADYLITSARQSLFSAAFLAHQSWLMADAIARTIWRLLVTRRHMLEWVSADRLAELDPTPLRVVRQMWAAPAIATAIALLVGFASPGRLLLVSPILVLWLLSPLIAYATGRPPPAMSEPLSETERAQFRRIARRTWQFFDELVGPSDHWLVPDNYQEDRSDVIAHRTSPTNIGLQLLSTLAAWDFGYLNTVSVLGRLEPTFTTLLGLPRYRGHFFNWYDTRTLTPLVPSYVSTVDSGNLAGYLLTLKTGLADLAGAPIIDARVLEGLDDVIGLCEQSMARAPRSQASRAFTAELTALREQLKERPGTLAAWQHLLSQVSDRVSAANVRLLELDETAGARDDADRATAAGAWLERAAAVIADRQTDLQQLTPWMALSNEFSPPLALPAGVPSLAGLVQWCRETSEAIEAGESPSPLAAAIERACVYAEDVLERIARLGEIVGDLVEETDFAFLFDADRQLFSIGFNVTDGRLDNSYYDTLASEARLASFVAIATGKVPADHWFRLGRSLTPSGASRALLSWSASMFEYLMPLLVMKSYPGTLLDETYRAVIDRQMEYAAKHGVPWGISESAYHAFDLERNYQYRAFGVPGLGLKRGLADELVVAPYASILAAPLRPNDVLENLAHLTQEGLAGRFGFYEAIDYTPERNAGQDGRGVVLPTYMAHHQGMSLVAIDNALNDWPMQQRFHAEPLVQAANLLLQERIPHLVPLKNPPVEIAEHTRSAKLPSAPSVRRYVTPHTLSPRAHLLSNGSYVVMVTNAGGGYSRRQGLALTRWREDLTCDGWGSFCYVRDLDTGDVWSTTYQPTASEPDEYEVTFAPDRAAWRRLDFGLEVRTELVVSPEDDAELRRVSISNLSDRPRTLDLTSYAEVVLAPGDADLAHPAFSNLFVETRFVAERDALICVRRPRGGTAPQYLVHILSGRGRVGSATQYETDRARFIGRGRTVERPRALFGDRALSNTTGAVLDPIVSLRQSIRIPPGGTARLAFTTAYADSEQAARHLIDKYQDRRVVARALALASTHSQVELRHLNLTVEDTMLFQRLAGRLVYADRRMRSASDVLRNLRSQRELWKYGISGDVPILLVSLADIAELPLVVEVLKAHEYLRLKGFAFDLVVLNEHPASYLQELQHALQRLVESGPEQSWINRPGGVFLRRADLMPEEDMSLMRAAARAFMSGADGGLRNQLLQPLDPYIVYPTKSDWPEIGADSSSPDAVAAPAATGDVEMFNGLGGFADDGREYVVSVSVAAGAVPPSPWTNVVANPQFGFAATESGPGYTWSMNSHDNRLTPWRNDPVCDQPGEVLYIRDDVTGQHWSATPLPSGVVPSAEHRYVVRHGLGYSAYEHARDGIASTLTLFVPASDPVKIFRLRLHNESGRRRRCSIALYAEWVLGENRSRTAIHVATGVDAHTGALTARNALRQELSGRTAFLDLSPGEDRTVTGDRTEFIGRNSTLNRPAALRLASLSNHTGATFDPCGAVQVACELAPGEERVVIGLLGDADNIAQLRTLVERYRDPQRVDEALSERRAFWDGLVGVLTVRTPDRAMDLMLNRWLLYQTLACRIWARSGFYQSSGAFGFRDQLQDTMALLSAAPHVARHHLLHAASRQFFEGDVQHWWHEPGGQGVRTRFSDDRLWLVYATLQYVAATGDDSVLDESVSFLRGRLLNPDEHEAYEQPAIGAESGSLYEHCIRAIEISRATGPHGLPLMGTGDWNDGMNLVGSGGQGESVWLGWFLIAILRPFADLAAARGEPARADAYRAHASALVTAVEDAWDGNWYRRAYFDDGTPLGSATNAECQIDAIAQSWAVISGAAKPDRARQAMESVDKRLVRRDDRLVLLLTPPFDHMVPSPGYIEGYLPGVRENGGQYTHAALWTVMAFAKMGDGDRAAELLAMLNPINHSRTAAAVEKYRSEPYVVAADVYSVAPHTGRGGWTWYTGSAGWMYRVGVESILGVTLRRGLLHIDPCIPRGWPGYELIYKPSRTPYRIVVENPAGVNRGVQRLEVDGVDRTGHGVEIVDDGAEHIVRVVLGASP